MLTFNLHKQSFLKTNLLTGHYDEKLCEDYDHEKCNEQQLGFMILPQRFEWCFDHKTLKILRLF